MAARLLVFLILALSLLAACATGKGSGFSREASREQTSRTPEQSTDDAEDKDKKPEAKPIPKLTIVTNPSNARITINGRLAGTGSASIESSGFGQKVEILVEAPSHRPRSLSVSLLGQTETIRIDLEPILGTLQLLGDLGEARLQAGGKALSPGDNRLLIGDYRVVARRFGFEDQTHSITIEEDLTTSLSLSFIPAPFALTRLKSNRPDGFNPDSASIAATVRLTFEASAPGRARLVLADSTGVELARWDYPRLSTWNQEALWDGRFQGTPLPDGVYTLTLTGGGGDEDTQKQALSVRIDRALIDTDRPSLGPASGLLWTPTPEVLSPGTLQLSFLGMGHVEGGLGHFPLSSSLRFAPAHGWELWGQTSFRVWTDPSLSSGYATFALKQRIPLDSTNFRLAWVAGGTLGTWLTGDPGIPPTDFLTTFPAVRVLLPAAWSWGKWTLVVTPEIDGSFWSPATAYEAATGAEEGFRLWGYGRLGLSYDPGSFSLALSGAARTRSFDKGTGWLAPAHLGLEARYPVPETPLTLTTYLSVSAYSTVDYAWYGGLGLSLLLPASLTLDLVSQVVTSP